MDKQPELFGDQKPIRDDAFMYRQLERLGEMMGDGLHHESDGKWISQEYTRICKILMPEMFAEKRKKKRESVDAQMSKLLSENKSPCCDAELRQTRKGTKACECVECNKKYHAVSKKK